jgi:chemotaxis protein CheD
MFETGNCKVEIGNCLSELSIFKYQSSRNMEITVGMGEIKVAKPPQLLKAVGIGSCVAVALYDRENRIGGLAHVMLPCFEEAYDKSNPTKFTDIAIAMMIDEMKRQGAQPQNIIAKVFGGANMFPEIISLDSAMDIGKRNILAVREELEGYNINIAASEVGGHIGRTVMFDTTEGLVVVKTANSEERKY